MEILLVCALGYLLGSLPYGLILVKIFKNQDIREIGSKNIGATNVLRAGYKLLALLTVILDAVKGALAVIISKYILKLDFDLYVLAGIFAIIGHIFPIWLKFKGGKGVATSFGTVLVLNPFIAFISFITWITVAFTFKYSSLAAIIAFIILPLWSLFFNPDLFYYLLFISLLSLYKHHENIKRLIKQEETKIRLKK